MLRRCDSEHIWGASPSSARRPSGPCWRRSTSWLTATAPPVGVTIVVVVALAGYLALRGEPRSSGSLRPIIAGTAAATVIGIAAFALAILLVAVTGRG